MKSSLREISLTKTRVFNRLTPWSSFQKCFSKAVSWISPEQFLHWGSRIPSQSADWTTLLLRNKYEQFFFSKNWKFNSVCRALWHKSRRVPSDSGSALYNVGFELEDKNMAQCSGHITLWTEQLLLQTLGDISRSYTILLWYSKTTPDKQLHTSQHKINNNTVN